MAGVRVLQVLDKISHNSGVSAVVMNYCRHMSDENIQIDFLLYEEPEQQWTELLKKKDIHIYVSGKPSARGIVTYKKNVEQFFCLHAGEYDIVHLHIPNAAFIVLKCAKKCNIPVRIMHSHNARGADGIVKKVRNFVLNKWGLLYANQYFSCGIEAAKYLFGKMKVDTNEVVIIHNAIELEKYKFDLKRREEIRKELGLKEEILLGHVGRFEEQKNHQGLLKIFRKLIDQNDNYRLVLLGDGPLREQIQREIISDGLEDKVYFKGIVNNVHEYLSAMDMFLLPSLYEGVPLVGVEAQAAGLPCLISNRVSSEIKLTDRVEFLDINESDAWCENIQKMKKHQWDRNNLEKNNLEQFDIKKQAIRLERLYHSYF